MRIGEIPAAIVKKWACVAVGNTGVVLTGERATHILSSHPEMAGLMGLIRETVLDADEVHRNKKDSQMAVFYRRIEGDYFLRVAVLMQAAPGELAHSIITARKAYKTEVERGRGRLVWRREGVSPGGTTNPSWP